MNNDGSIAVSLRELMRLEDDRVERERQTQRRRLEEEAEASAARQRQAREEELSALYAEHARQSAEAEREREMAARLDGIGRAEVERARLEARDEALATERSAEMRHAEELARLGHDLGGRRLRLVIAALTVTTVAVVAGFGAYYRLEMKPEAARRAALAEADQKSADEKVHALERDLQRVKGEIDRAKDAMNAVAPVVRTAPAPAPVPTFRPGPANHGVVDRHIEIFTRRKVCPDGDPFCIVDPTASK